MNQIRLWRWKATKNALIQAEVTGTVFAGHNYTIINHRKMKECYVSKDIRKVYMT
jgi:hypothetical protein